MNNMNREIDISLKKINYMKYCKLCLLPDTKPQLTFDENNNVTHCLIEAVISHRAQQIDWIELKESEHWLQGWK